MQHVPVSSCRNHSNVAFITKDGATILSSWRRFLVRSVPMHQLYHSNAQTVEWWGDKRTTLKVLPYRIKIESYIFTTALPIQELLCLELSYYMYGKYDFYKHPQEPRKTLLRHVYEEQYKAVEDPNVTTWVLPLRLKYATRKHDSVIIEGNNRWPTLVMHFSVYFGWFMFFAWK